MTVPPIGHLLSSSCPSAITRFVVTVIVDAIYRLAWRALTHIRQEILKLSPALTDGNAAQSVVGMRVVNAPIKDAVPYPMRWRPFKAVRFSAFLAVTPAAINAPLAQMLGEDGLLATAITPAQPVSAVRRRRLFADGGKPAESFPCDVYKHNRILST